MRSHQSFKQRSGAGSRWTHLCFRRITLATAWRTAAQEWKLWQNHNPIERQGIVMVIKRLPMWAKWAGGDQQEPPIISKPSIPKTKHSDSYGMPARCPITPEQQVSTWWWGGKEEPKKWAGKGPSPQTDKTIQLQVKSRTLELCLFGPG